LLFFDTVTYRPKPIPESQKHHNMLTINQKTFAPTPSHPPVLKNPFHSGALPTRRLYPSPAAMPTPNPFPAFITAKSRHLKAKQAFHLKV
jgi:hypothetical protein